MSTKTYQLSDLVTIKYGKNQKKVANENGNIPIYGTGGLMGFASQALYDKPSVLIGRKGSIDKVKYVDHPFWTVDTLFYTVVNEDIVIPKYLYYLMSLIDMKQYNEGTTIPSLRTETLNRIELEIPPIDYQKKVLECLNPIDAKINNNEAINRNLQEQLKIVFSSWFYDTTPFGGKEPKGTQYVPLEELCALVTKGTTPTTLGMPFTDDGVNFIKGETILENHGFDRTKLSFVSKDTHEKLRRSQIESGDIVFTIAGTLGRFALVDDSMTPANTNQAVAIVRANKVSPEYLYSFFIGNWHNDYYTKRIQQAVQANLSLGTIRSLPIMLLQEELYEQYLEIITPLIKETKRIEQENLKLSELRDNLLPRLMSGELDASDLDI